MTLGLSVLQGALPASLESSTSEPESSQTERSLADADTPGPREILVQMGVLPEEYLIELIREHGGRVWQQDLIEETGWNPSTISNYLSDLEAEGRIVRLQIGREKAVGLPGAFESADPDSESEQILPA